MSEATSAAEQPPTSAAPRADRASRVLRLAQKELRETLRDRRTIATLVLMPLLVYPVLSLAFRQFLLSSLELESGPMLVVTRNEAQLIALDLLIRQGDRLLDDRPGSGVGLDQDAKEPTLDEVKIGYDDQHDLGRLVREQGYDLAVRVHPRGPVSADGPQGFADLELIYLPGNPRGAQAARFVERRLQAVNDGYVRQRLVKLGDSGELPASWRREPIVEEAGKAFGLATIVPLILILMTMTGAVYPAIDLTAGERERGTLESLMAAPIPRLSLLFAKYLAVVTVAMLTAVVNVVGMGVTVLSTGLGPVLFGERGLSLSAVAMVFALLLLFAAFFSALLLCVTSFARSFKEAQAYLIPLMLVALAPGLVSVMPGLRLNAWMSIAPLANIVLLARDVLEGDAHPLWGMVAVASTALYGTAALGLASRVFGGDAILYGSQPGWQDLWRRPEKPAAQASLADAMTLLAVIAPLFVVLAGFLAQLDRVPMSIKLCGSAGITMLLFLAIPLAAARWQLVLPVSGFSLRRAPAIAFVGAGVLGVALWPLAHELIIFSREINLATLSAEQLARLTTDIARFVAECRATSPLLVWGAIALMPAVCEELFFGSSD